VSLLESLSCFDWISPCIAIVQGVLNGDALGANSWTFYVPLDNSWTGAQLEILLKRHGVKIWARLIHRGDIHFRVHKKQAKWGEYVLLRAGVPLKYRLYSESNLRYVHPQPSRPPATNNWLVSLLDDVLGI